MPTAAPARDHDELQALLPWHRSLAIAHNPHHGAGETVEEWFDEFILQNIDPMQRVACIATDEVWSMRWDEGPFIHHYVVGATLSWVLMKAKLLEGG